MDFYVIRLISLSAVLGTVSGYLMCVCSHRDRDRERGERREGEREEREGEEKERKRSKFMNKCNFSSHREHWNIEKNGRRG